ncbi:MAG: alpha/beta hydrolase [Acidobacteriota bacterium]
MSAELCTVDLPGGSAPTVRVFDRSASEPSDDGVSPAVLLAHPFLPVEQLSGLIELLGRERRVVAVDVTDLATAALERGDWSASAEAFRNLLPALEIERHHLAGVHFGGLLAQQIAVESLTQESSGLRSLTLISTHTGGDHEIPPHERTLDSLKTGLIAEAAPELRHQAILQLIHAGTLRRRPRVVDQLETLLAERRLSASEVERWWSAAGAFGVFESFPEIDLPVLVLHGEIDPVAPAENARVLERQIPGAERVQFNDSGHFFFAEDPGATYAALQTFLERVETYVP